MEAKPENRSKVYTVRWICAKINTFRCCTKVTTLRTLPALAMDHIIVPQHTHSAGVCDTVALQTWNAEDTVSRTQPRVMLFVWNLAVVARHYQTQQKHLQWLMQDGT